MDFIPIFLRELENYKDSFHSRILPAFSEIEREAEAASNAELERISANAGPDSDPETIQETAYFHEVDLFLTAQATKQGVVNLMTAGLYHLSEQHAQRLSRICRDGRSDSILERIRPLLDASDGKPKPRFPKPQLILNELQLVANTVKHGEGRSCNSLYKSNPALFKTHSETDDLRIPASPLSGEGLYLKPEDFDRYHFALLDFWKRLAQLPPKEGGS